jgi:hypothetical protein
MLPSNLEIDDSVTDHISGPMTGADMAVIEDQSVVPPLRHLN